MVDLDVVASSPNVSNVLATSSTLSRYELATSLASRTVSNENSLEVCNVSAYLTHNES